MGMTPEQARAEALRRFGDFEHIKEACREISREKLANRFHLRAIKGFIWNLRAMQPIRHHVRTKGGQLLILAEATPDKPSSSSSIPEERAEHHLLARDQYGRTPVERLLADDE
jgi:hypothetical protein